MSKDCEQAEVATPLSVVLDMAKSEVEICVMTCMENNHIPPDLMMYVMKDILLNLSALKSDRLTTEFVRLQKEMKGAMENGG